MTRMSHAVALAAALGLSPFANAQDPQEEDKLQPPHAAQPMPEEVTEFFRTAASANQLEIDSSRLAIERATDPALKSFARRMVRDHEKASRELKALARKKDVRVSSMLLKRHEAMLNDLRDEPPGREFDNQYRDLMITGHKEAVSLFDDAARYAQDAEVRAFAGRTLPTLQAHGGSARELPEPQKR